MVVKKVKGVKGRDRVVTVSAINVVLHPHSPAKYVSFFKDLFSSRLNVTVRGQTALMLGSCRSLVPDRPDQGLTGQIYKFFKLDTSAPWFDTLTKRAADSAALGKINIPSHLKPQLEEFSYVFFPKGHRLYFISGRTGGSLAPSFLLSYMEKVTEESRFSKYGSIKFTVEPDEDSLTEIFKMPRLKSLFLDIHRPNPDDQQAAEDKFFKRLTKMNASREQVKYFEASSAGISPDSEAKVLAKIASSNGVVIGSGDDANGKSQSLSTKEHPLKEKMTFNSNAQTEQLALQDFAIDLHKRLT